MNEAFHDFQASVEDWHWWYSVRRDILDEKLRPLPLAPSRGRARPQILDLGCGTGGASLVLHRYGDAVAFDRASAAHALAPDRPYAARVIGAADRTLPFADASFDAAVALDVLEHLDDDAAAVAGAPGAWCGRAAFSSCSFPRCNCSGATTTCSAIIVAVAYRAGQLGSVVGGGPFVVREQGYFNLALFLPTLAARLAQRVLPRATSGMEHAGQPGLVNDLLTLAFRAELPWLRRGPLPLGTSAYCVAERVGA